ncbi:UDP-glucose 4-epimerase [Desulfocucumis palustris]|uniref:UDP-glucose 4-epimerase n=1 Tax=Desulfocucumis palustris TaxID=1898651 RepID=A0A2L2XCJ5_9FIRM|nr:NAD(P)-dependent oxidoreductase [Desulfocucumis palustris]GBF33423.1 UDP-glucose 4-epimerase [Desulfocucumis palustris]
MNSRIFVAGGTGMAGSSIVKHLANKREGIKIRAGYLNSSPFFKHRQVEYIKCDLNSLDNCRKMAGGCDAGILAAASTAGAYAINNNPWGGVNENLLMNANLMEACRLEGVRRVILVGSAVVYQEHHSFIREEELDLNRDPPGVYFGVGWMRRYLEKMARFWHDKFGLEVVVIRLANIYGPCAKFDPGFSNFIPAIIRKAVEGMDPFEVWGGPEVTRDVLYVDDFARAIAMILESPGINCEIFNIGSGTKTTVGEVVELVLKLTGFCPGQVVYNRDKPTTMGLRALDCSKAKRLLGWEPLYTAEQGIKETIKWWTENKNTWKK